MIFEVGESAMAPGRASLGEPFDRLKPGERLFIRPAIPRHAEHHEYQVKCVTGGLAVIDTVHTNQPLSISAAAVAHLHTSGDHSPP
ncbi:MAG TPA: hypothetical protein VL523_15595, partial [Terriglobia bacterium]|nr:hypothetical protein [Terriglobia bacterium]